MIKLLKRNSKRFSFYRQVVLGILSLVLLLTISSSILNYFELKDIATKVAKQSLLTDASSLQADLSTRLISLAAANQTLAGNPLIGNALVDDIGRDIYLSDFLEGYRSAEGFTMKVALSNFAGDLVSENHLEIPLLAEQQWLQKIVDSGKASSLLVKKLDEPVLLIAEPVLFKNTGLPEGALVFQVTLSEWLTFNRVRQVYNEGLTTGKLSLRYIDNSTKNLESISSRTGNGLSELTSIFFLELGQSLAPLNISLELTAKEGLVAGPARELLIRFSMIGLLFLLVAVSLSTVVAKKLSRKLVKLKESVSGIEDYSTANIELSSEGMDEVDDLSESFDTVINKLQEAYQQLEYQSQKQLEESEGRYRAIVNNSADAIITIDTDGVIETFNPAAEKIFGYQADEVIGENTSILLPDAHRKEHEYYVNNSKLYEARVLDVSRELIGQKKNGGTFPVEVNISPVVFRGKKSFVGVIRDVSERRAYEDGLQMAKIEAEEASRAKSEFLSSMSHELRTPLNAILGFSQVMQIDTKLDKSDYQNVTEIINAGQHLLELVDEVLDLARIEAGRTSIQMEKLPVNKIIDECMLLVKSQAKNHGVSLHKVYAECDNLYVLADKVRLKQVLLNLLSNAIKYNRDNGSVTLSCRETGAGRLSISVTDTGPGICEESQEKIFTPFNRLGREGSNIEGTGIGLTITKRLVEMMGGEITLNSVKGEGSTFSLDLEKAEKEQLATETEEKGNNVMPVEDKGKLVSILYIEDNPANLRLMECLLEKFARFDLRCAEEPVSGLEMARENKPDIILLDIQLPTMDGYEVLDKLKTSDETASIPVIAVTADALNTSIEGAMEAGFDDYLTKPIKADKLINSIDNALLD